MLLEVNTVHNIGRFITLLLIFAFVLAITYFSTKYVADFQKAKINNSNIKVLETMQIAPNKYIQLVSIGKKYFAIAVSKDNVTVIGEIEEDMIDLSLSGNNELPSFAGILKSARDKLGFDIAKDSSENDSKNDK